MNSPMNLIFGYLLLSLSYLVFDNLNLVFSALLLHKPLHLARVPTCTEPTLAKRQDILTAGPVNSHSVSYRLSATSIVDLPSY